MSIIVADFQMSVYQLLYAGHEAGFDHAHPARLHWVKWQTEMHKPIARKLVAQSHGTILCIVSYFLF